MQQQERDLITDLFGRLKAFEGQARDPEAERLIAGLIASQPAASYLLTQTVLVQEQALKGAQARIAELEAKTAAAPAAGSGFLSSAPKIGPWGSAPQAAAPSRSPLQAAVAPAAPAGGGFMRQALATAAGVAGGALLFEGIRNMMGHTSNPFGGSTAAAPLVSPDAIASSSYAQNDIPADDYDVASADDSGFGGSDDTA